MPGATSISVSGSILSLTPVLTAPFPAITSGVRKGIDRQPPDTTPFAARPSTTLTTSISPSGGPFAEAPQRGNNNDGENGNGSGNSDDGNGGRAGLSPAGEKALISVFTICKLSRHGSVAPLTNILLQLVSSHCLLLPFSSGVAEGHARRTPLRLETGLQRSQSSPLLTNLKSWLVVWLQKCQFCVTDLVTVAGLALMNHMRIVLRKRGLPARSNLRHLCRVPLWCKPHSRDRASRYHRQHMLIASHWVAA